jgi:hypothetical protein
MNSNLYAVIMGFNKYVDQTYLPELEFAEKDAHDLYLALTDPHCGDVPEANVSLITGNVSREKIEMELYVKAVRERSPRDTVLIFYSGHGFLAGDGPEAYLATPGTSISDIVKNPNAGLRIEFLRRKVFRAFPKNRASNMITLLDCCHCGSFLPGVRGNHVTQPKRFFESHDFDSEGRFAFVASPTLRSKKESKTLKNGVFTYYLINGLRGAAMESFTSEVTMDSLVSYVKSMCPEDTMPAFYGTMFSRIVLTHPTAKTVSQKEIENRHTKVSNYSAKLHDLTSPDVLITNQNRRNPYQNLETRSQNPLRVFLCHSSYDKPAVRNLYLKLSAESGIDPWLDEQKLLPGEDWDLEIRTAVKSSDVVLVFLSTDSINKEGYVQKEIRQALDVADEKPEGTIFIIPLRLEDCDVPPRLQRWQWLNLFEDNSYDRLLRSLRKRANHLKMRNLGK